MILENILPRYGEAFLRLFYPSLCATCNGLLELEERGLCLSCRQNFQKLRLLPSEERIRVSLSYGEEAWALFRYDGCLKEIFHRIKFGRRRDLLRLFREDLSLFFTRRPQLTAYDRVIAIPLDFRRRLTREFNQSGVIASQVHEILRKKRDSSPPRLEGRALLKGRSTPPQSLLGRRERQLNLDQAFRVPAFLRIRGQSVLLVDDIFTTGATLEQAAKTLKQAGASKVGYLVLARAFAR